jgi:signal transduction histidine kinase
LIKVVGFSNAMVEGDKYRLEEVITNFLSNAFKYSPDSPEIVVSYSIKDNEAVVSVEDHGVGISPTNSKSIFKRYFRVEDKSYNFTGLGVGLYICKEIIQRHHGKVWLESEEGKGSKFFFSIPLKQPVNQPMSKIA